MQVKVKFYTDTDRLDETEWQPVTAAEFLKLYFSGKYAGYNILSMLWTDKGETYKLVFGD